MTTEDKLEQIKQAHPDTFMASAQSALIEIRDTIGKYRGAGSLAPHVNWYGNITEDGGGAMVGHVAGWSYKIQSISNSTSHVSLNLVHNFLSEENHRVGFFENAEDAKSVAERHSAIVDATGNAMAATVIIRNMIGAN